MYETLKSRNGYQSFEWTQQILDDAAHGKVFIYRMGKRVPHKLSVQQWGEFDEAKRRGYVICRDIRANAPVGIWAAPECPMEASGAQDSQRERNRAHTCGGCRGGVTLRTGEQHRMRGKP